jgi:short-subunit dehydrogenase
MISATPGVTVPDSRIRAAATSTIRSWFLTLSSREAGNGGGAFVNLLSSSSWVGLPGLATYSASKSAAWGWTNAARIELNRQGTQVLGVHVHFVDTDLTAGLDVEKVAPEVVATSALDALERGDSEVIVDDFSRTVKSALHDDHNLIYPGIADSFNAAATH